MDVPVTTPSFASRNLRFADFRDGKTVDYTRASPEEWLPALQRLEQQWVKYDHMFLPTMKKFPAPKDIPKDLFMKWTDFARKYNVEAATEIIRTNVAQDPTDSTTMDMYRAFDTTILRVFAGTGDPLQTIDHNNLAVFERAMELLGDDVMYESEVISSKRTKNGVRLVVRSSNGRTVLVKARRLLVAIQPDAAKPGSLDLDANERKLLARSMANRFFVGLISHPSLPFNTTYYNIIPEASPNNRLLYPANPSFAELRYVGDSSSGGLYRIVLSGPPGYTFEDAKQLIRTSLQKLMDTGLLSAGDANDIDFKTFDDHGSLYRSYAVKDLKDDIIRKLNALQGVRSTWRVGGAIGTTNLCMLWAQVDVVLEDLTKGL
ncbi:Beta-cyclopiazonate dehydrogenase like protein [Verticillium longisporum]|nr:Beta-cyclopiazonate dehydrogenase like protein [Verticillium longisporum]